MVRNEYRITYMAKKVRQLAIRQSDSCLAVVPSAISEEVESPVSYKSRLTTSSPKTVRGRAKAQQIAMQNAKMRMIKQKDPDFLFL